MTPSWASSCSTGLSQCLILSLCCSLGFFLVTFHVFFWFITLIWNKKSFHVDTKGKHLYYKKLSNHLIPFNFSCNSRFYSFVHHSGSWHKIWNILNIFFCSTSSDSSSPVPFRSRSPLSQRSRSMADSPNMSPKRYKRSPRSRKSWSPVRSPKRPARSPSLSRFRNKSPPQECIEAAKGAIRA